MALERTNGFFPLRGFGGDVPDRLAADSWGTNNAAHAAESEDVMFSSLFNVGLWSAALTALWAIFGPLFQGLFSAFTAQ